MEKKRGSRNMLQLISRSIQGNMAAYFKKNPIQVKTDTEYTQFVDQITEHLDGLTIEIKKLLSTIKSPETNIEIETGAKDFLAQFVQNTDIIKEKFNTLPENFTRLELLLREIEKKGLSIHTPEPPPKVEFPKVQSIKGEVSGNVKVQNQIDIAPVLKKLDAIGKAVASIKIPESPKVEFPKITIPKAKDTISVKEAKAIITSINKLQKSIESIPNQIKIPEVSFPSQISVDNFPPQRYPLPPTHISINALGGTVKSRAVTVSTSLTPLPGEALANRRSIIIYNNSSVTVEIGGSTFTFGEGLPVPPKTYSPPYGAGDDTIIYGRVSTGTADVRTMEISDIPMGR